MAAWGDGLWRFVYLLLGAVYFMQYGAMESLRKQAFTLSALCISASLWQQPFVCWPEVVKLEAKLLPGVLFLWIAGRIWKESEWFCGVRHAGYGICLGVLCVDAVCTGLVADALLVEGIGLGGFIWAQVKGCWRWTRIFAAVILGMALFMTRAFWLSIAWWAYLLAAGVGLLVFAGVMEKKRQQSKET